MGLIDQPRASVQPTTALKVRAEAGAKAEEAATRAVAERAEALRRLRLAHDVEMRKAGRDVLRLEREARRYQQQQGQGQQVSAWAGGRVGSVSLISCSFIPVFTIESWSLSFVSVFSSCTRYLVFSS